jgi:6-phosphofructokinase
MLTAYDRILARPLETATVQAFADGDAGTKVAIRGDAVKHVPLQEVVENKRELDPEVYKMAEVLAEPPE